MPIYKTEGSKDGKQRYKVQINYKDSYGKNRQTSRITYGLQEAKALERILAAELKSRPPEARITLDELFAEYKASSVNRVKESTLINTEKWLRLYVLPELGNTAVSSLSVPVLQRWKNSLETKTVHNSDKALSLKTKQNIYGAFCSVLNFAVRMEYIPSNPLTKVGSFKDAEIIKKEMQYYTVEEFKRYIAEAKQLAEQTGSVSDWDFFMFFSIAFYTGMRKGEIHALKWSDISDGFLTVSRSINQKLKGGDKETRPKTASSVRTLQIPKPLIELLSEHKKRWNAFKGFSDDYRVCGGTRSLRDTSLQKRNERYAKAAGLKIIRIHDFRHSHVSLLANEGINIQEVARRLGHARVEETWNTYSHMYPREEERAVAVLNTVNI